MDVRAPTMLARVYREELRLLDQYARGELASTVSEPHGLPWASAR